MANALAFIGGGLLQGIGKGLVLDGKEKRERALADLEHTRKLDRDERQLEGRRGLLGTGIEARTTAADTADERAKAAAELTAGARVEASKAAARVASTAADELNKRKVEAAGKKAESAKEVAKIRAGKTTDTSAADSRVFENLQDIHSSVDQLSGETVPDWGKISKAIADMPNASSGLKALGKEAGRKGKGIADLDIRKRAEEFADEMVDEQSSAFLPDSSDFKDDGGSRVKFRARMVREFIAKNSGTAAPATRPAGATSAAPTGPFVGNSSPADQPDAKRAPDGFWYVKRDGRTWRVLKTKENALSGRRRGPR